MRNFSELEKRANNAKIRSSLEFPFIQYIENNISYIDRHAQILIKHLIVYASVYVFVLEQSEYINSIYGQFT